MCEAHHAGVPDLLARNRAWASAKTSADPGFFKRLDAGQSPPYLWIGCSDSRAPPSVILGLEPGEMFVHRNVANLASPGDPSVAAVLQYAVQVLKVRHILVAGHYGCGGVRAVAERLRLGPIDGWLSPIREVAQAHAAELEAIPDEAARLDRLCELNVLRQVQNVAANPFVADAWATGAELSVHGWCYSLADGLVTDLGATVSGPLFPAGD